MNSTAKTATSQPGTLRPDRTNWNDQTAAANIRTAVTQPVTTADTTISGNTNASLGAESRKVTELCGAPMAKTRSARTESTARMTGVFQFRTISVAAEPCCGSVAVAVLMLHLRCLRSFGVLQSAGPVQAVGRLPGPAAERR